MADLGRVQDTSDLGVIKVNGKVEASSLKYDLPVVSVEARLDQVARVFAPATKMNAESSSAVGSMGVAQTITHRRHPGERIESDFGRRLFRCRPSVRRSRGSG